MERERRAVSHAAAASSPSAAPAQFALPDLPPLTHDSHSGVALPDPPLGSAPEVAFLLHGVLPAETCDALVAFAEARDFRAALLSEDSTTGGYPDPDVRKCGMLQLDDDALATALWSRIRPALQAMSWDGLELSFPAGTRWRRRKGAWPRAGQRPRCPAPQRSL